ncbi:MAG: hypothetical protein QNJ16_15455 [Rhodobacter sp.]|nr:hypothetical protein [Rhodobacter sp.]
MKDYGHHHHLVVVAEDEHAARRCLVSLLTGLELLCVDQDPSKDVLDRIAYVEPDWPDGLTQFSERFDFILSDGRPTRAPMPPITSTGVSGELSSVGDDPPSGTPNLPVPVPQPPNFTGLDFFVTIPADLAGILPGRGAPETTSAWSKIKDIYRKASEVPNAQPSPNADQPGIVRVRVTGHVVAQFSLLSDAPNSFDREILDPIRTHADETEDGSDPAPQSLSFLFETTLTNDHLPRGIGLTRLASAILDLSSTIEEMMVFSKVVTCCVSDALAPASYIPSVAGLNDAVQLLAQELVGTELWMGNAWIDVFGTIYSRNYRAKVSELWSGRWPEASNARKLLEEEGIAMAVVDCDFGGLNIDSAEIAYILSRGPQRDKFVSADRMRHTVFGQDALEVARAALGSDVGQADIGALRNSWRPYRTRSLLMSCLSGNHSMARTFRDEHQIVVPGAT